MEVQEFFYWVASIALILFALFTISLFALLFYIKRRVDNISAGISSATKAWRNLTTTRFILRTLRLLF